MIKSPRDVVNFWFSEDVKSKWFDKDPEFDKQIKEMFLETYKFYLQTGLSFGIESAEDYLAYVIVMDQFPRNMFRDTPKAFSSDKQALEGAKEAILKGLDQNLDPAKRKFLYMPFMHSEKLDVQEAGLKLFESLDDPETYKYALAHHDIIKKFNRFPHRNSTLGRHSTRTELEFLRQPGSSF